MSPDTIQKLMTLNLTTEQMAVVFEVLTAEIVSASVTAVQPRGTGAERQARWRKRHKASQIVTSNESNVTVTAEKEKFPPAPPSKENTSNLKVFGQIAREPDPAIISGFAEFWNCYPKRAGNVDKRSALKAFLAAIKRETLETIINGAMRYAAHCDQTQKTGTEFVRQARTWLNADGWKEEYRNGSSFNKPHKPTILERFAAGVERDRFGEGPSDFGRHPLD